MVVPYPAGGIVDIATRIVTDKLSDIWHQPIVVETKPGASGNLAWDQVSRAKPDGYTWTFLGPATMANPHMYANLRWSEKSFVPVGATVWGPSALVVHPSLVLDDFSTPARALSPCFDRPLLSGSSNSLSGRLSFPKIISAHSDGAVRKELAW
jgi:tripartite-type tricarboxylate transporter receptor subunit TctC